MSRKHYSFFNGYYHCFHCGTFFKEERLVVMHIVSDHPKKKPAKKRKRENSLKFPLKGVHDGRFIP